MEPSSGPLLLLTQSYFQVNVTLEELNAMRYALKSPSYSVQRKVPIWSRYILDPCRVKRVSQLIYPLCTVLDDSIGCALWFGARGRGLLYGHPQTVHYVCQARVGIHKHIQCFASQNRYLKASASQARVGIHKHIVHCRAGIHKHLG